MPGALPVLKLGPISYQVSGLITGGQLVVATGATNAAPFPAAPSAQTVMACTSANVTGLAAGFPGVLGVAGNDANVLTMPALPVNAGAGYPAGFDQVLDISQLQDYVSVYTLGEFTLNYEAACPFGQAIVAGTAGGVVPYNNGTHRPDAIIGRCTQAGGVTAAGAALAYICTI